MITPAGDAYSGEQLTLDLPLLRAGACTTIAAPPRDECVVVLLAGAVEWARATSTRATTFTERASAWYLPPGTELEVVASRDSELALAASATADLTVEASAGPAHITPDDIVVHQRGEPGWQRDVHDIVDARVPAQRLLVGETFNRPGEWSSFPPHKHDGRDGEPALEEVYAFRFDTPQGFGFLGIYDGTTERAEFLRHGSVVGFTRGYHPVVGAPGCRLMYLWVLAGRERRLVRFEDPAYERLSAPRARARPPQ